MLNGGYQLIDEATEAEESEGELKLIYENGKFFNETTLEEIRTKINLNI